MSETLADRLLAGTMLALAVAAPTLSSAAPDRVQAAAARVSSADSKDMIEHVAAATCCRPGLRPGGP